MAIEIERKFLVRREAWKDLEKGDGILYRQGYLLTDRDKTIRVRTSDKNAFLTIKGATAGMSRSEFEYEIPLGEAEELLEQFASSVITKVRYRIIYEGKLWEVDEFRKENEGLLLAEIELESEDESFPLPSWIGKEVTGDRRYYNACLANDPYADWADREP